MSIAPPDFVASKWTAVCSEHIKEDSFVKTEKYTTLAKHAIPSVFKNSTANNELSNPPNKNVQEENIGLRINVNTLSAVSFVHLFSDNFHWSIGTDFETLNFECFKSVKDAGVTKKVRTVLFA